MKRHQRIIDKYDPTDPDNWERVAPADGNKGYGIYLPLKGLK